MKGDNGHRLQNTRRLRRRNPQVSTIRGSGRDGDPGLHRLHGESSRCGSRRPAPEAVQNFFVGGVRTIFRPRSAGRGSHRGRHRDHRQRGADRSKGRGEPCRSLAFQAHHVLRAADVLRQWRRALLDRVGQSLQGDIRRGFARNRVACRPGCGEEGRRTDPDRLSGSAKPVDRRFQDTAGRSARPVRGTAGSLRDHGCSRRRHFDVRSSREPAHRRRQLQEQRHRYEQSQVRRRLHAQSRDDAGFAR